MHCAYNAGVLDALAAHPEVPRFDIVIASSGSSGPATYYVTDQLEHMNDAWGQALATKKLINLWRFWKILDVDYLVGDVLMQQFPLDLDKLYTTDQRLYIPAVNYKTGRMRYFSNHNHDDIPQAIKASHSAPVFTKGAVKIDGKGYHDSFTTSYPYFHIGMARRMQAKKIVVISCLTQPPGRLTRFEQWVTRKHPEGFKDRIFERSEQMIRHYDEKDHQNIFRITPSEKIPCSQFDTNGERLMSAVNLGRKDGRAVEWKGFFE